MPDIYGHCGELVRAGDKDRFLASLFAPPAHRAALHALYAFDLETAGVRDRIHEALAGEIRLQWWSEILDGTRETGGHPVAEAILKVAAEHRLPLGALKDLIDARTADLYDDPLRTLVDLEEYARRTSSSVIALAARILGDEPGPAAIVMPAGIVDAIVVMLRAFAHRVARGQIQLPADIMEHHGVRREELLAGTAGQGLDAVLSELRGYARRHLQTLEAALDALSPRLIPALLPIAVARLYLERMEASDYDPFRTPVEIAQWRRQWTLWRAARAPRRIVSG